MRHWSALVLLVLVAGTPAVHAQSYHVDFEGIPDGTPAEQVSTSGVQFRPDPGGTWFVAPAFFTGLRGQMLFQPRDPPGGSLDIVFATAVTSVSFDFAQRSEQVGATSLVIEAYRGGTPVGSARQPTTFIGVTFAEGGVSFATAVPFDTIRISSSPETLIAIDNISAPAGQLPPEPPPEGTFTAVPQVIALGQEATLSWSVPGAPNVTIDNGIGSQPPAASTIVRPAQSTTYRLTAQAGGRSVALEARVEVVAVPVLAVTASLRGLTQAANAGGALDSFVLSNFGGAVAAVTLQAQGGFFNVSPSSFSLQQGASQAVTLTGIAQPAGAYQGTVTVGAAGVAQTISIPGRMLSAVPPAGTVDPQATAPRLDLRSIGSASVTGSVTFRNDGNAVLQGMAQADQPWVIPEAGLITIQPGQSRAVSFTVDPTKRTAGQGSEQATISLVYIGGSGNALRAVPTQSGSSQSVSVALVHTTAPSVSGGGIPALEAGQAAWFLPGLVRTGSLVTDVVALMRRSSPSPTNLNLFYLGGSLPPSQGRLAAFASVAPSATLPLSDLVKSVFDDPAASGTLQIRSLATHPVAVTGKVFNVARADGLFGTSLASFRSDRGVSGSQRVVLPGIRGEGADSTRFFVQEVSGIATAARTELLDATGGVLLSRTDEIEPFAMRELAIAVPPGAVTAVVTNTGVGRVIARALLSDSGSGDITDLVDWTIRNAIGPTEPQVIPILDRGAGSRQTELIIANRGPETLSGTLSSFSSGPGRRRAVAHGSGGGGFPFRIGWNAIRSPAMPDATVEINLPAGQTRVLADALAELGAHGASHLVFTPAAGSGSITARTQRTFAGGGVFRTALPVVSSGVALRLGETREFGGIESAGPTASDARQPSSFGSSLTLVETAGQEAVVRVTLQFTPAIASGLVSLRGQAKKDYTLEANKLLQIADIAAEIIGPSRGQFGDLRNMQIDVSVVSGQGAVVPVLTERENATGDLIVRLE